MGCRVDRHPAQAEHAAVTVRVPFAASSVAVARQQLRSWMRAQGCSREAIEDGRVVLSELVANSVRHAQPLSDGTILVSWCREGGDLRISVTDGGSTSRPHTVNAGSSALSGRGMAIVEALAGQWWFEQTRTRSTVHARIPMA